MKLDWKNIFGAAFFVAALFGSGLARALEKPVNAPNQNSVCDCSRSGFSTPNCAIIKEQVFGTGAVGAGARGLNHASSMPPTTGPASQPSAPFNVSTATPSGASGS